MMQKVKRRIFAGAVCEQEVYTVSDRADVKKSYIPRIKDPDERAQHNIGISRRRHALLFNENFSPTSLYGTFTFDQENEVHSADECKYIRDLFIRKIKRKYPDAVIFAYYGMGKNTHRFHIHMVTEGVPEEFLRKKWIYGDVKRIEPLRKNCRYNKKDHGRNYKGLANYLFDHWRPEFGAHRWKMTKNAKKPHEEKAAVTKKKYSEQRPPRAPKGYTLVDYQCNKYGFMIFTYVRFDDGSTRKNE